MWDLRDDQGHPVPFRGLFSDYTRAHLCPLKKHNPHSQKNPTSAPEQKVPMTLILPEMASISQQTPAKVPTLTYRATEPPIPALTAFPRPERKAKENLGGRSKEETRTEHVFKNLREKGKPTWECSFSSWMCIYANPRDTTWHACLWKPLLSQR